MLIVAPSGSSMNIPEGNFLDLLNCYRTFEVMRDVMEVGVPELNIPVLEPVFLGLIDFKFYNLTVQFIDVSMKGFKTFKLLDSHLNKTSGYDKIMHTYRYIMALPYKFRIQACGGCQQCYRKCLPPGLTSCSGLFLQMLT